MTKYVNRVAFYAHKDHAEACNRAANALGRSGNNFSVPLTPDGVLTTHYGGSAKETDAFVYALAYAPELPEGFPWPEDLDPADWQTVSEELIYIADALEVDASTQFKEFVSANGLSIFEPSPIEIEVAVQV